MIKIEDKINISFTREDLEILEWSIDISLSKMRNRIEQNKIEGSDNMLFVNEVNALERIQSNMTEELFLNKYCNLKKINVFASEYDEDFIVYGNMINTYLRYGFEITSYQEFVNKIKYMKSNEYKNDPRNICFISERMLNYSNPKKQTSLIKMILRKIKDIDDIKIILVCKNPYILNAIEVYAEYYGMKNNYNIYYVDKEQNIKNMTTCTNYIYEYFSEPLQDLEITYYDLLHKED